MATDYTATLVTDWSDYTRIFFEITDASGERVETVVGVTTAYEWMEIEGVREVNFFDDTQFTADLESTLAAQGWTVTDWTAEHGDYGAIVGATVTKATV